MKKRLNAYFTVEAALIFPIITGVIVMLLYLLFFQYDRCLLEQEIGSLALKGCSMAGENKEETGKVLQQMAQKIYWDKFIAWEMCDMNIDLSGNAVVAEGKAVLGFPFESFAGNDIGKIWGVKAEYKNTKTDAVRLIRLYRELGGE